MGQNIFSCYVTFNYIETYRENNGYKLYHHPPPPSTFEFPISHSPICWKEVVAHLQLFESLIFFFMRTPLHEKLKL